MTHSSHINNSFELKEKLKNITITDEYSLLSLDVTSLFTNISCELVLDSLDRRAFSIHNHCNIPIEELKECTAFLFNNMFFTFNDRVYQQIYGTPMGSPISPLFADIIMDDLEKNCLRELELHYDCTPIFYYRYVDGTLICVKKHHIDTVIKVFNAYDINLKFTYELKENKKKKKKKYKLVPKTNITGTCNQLFFKSSYTT